MWGNRCICEKFISVKLVQPPPVDLTVERRNGDFVRGLILSGAVTACHDVADGGVLVAVAEMALAGKRGAAVGPAERCRSGGFLVWRGSGALSAHHAGWTGFAGGGANGRGSRHDAWQDGRHCFIIGS